MSRNTFLYSYFPFFIIMQSDTINKKRHVLYSIRYVLQSPSDLVTSAIVIFVGTFFLFSGIYSGISGTLKGPSSNIIFSLIMVLFTSILFLVMGLILWPRFPHVIILYENRMEFTHPYSNFLFQNHSLKKIPYSNIKKIDFDPYTQEFRVHLKIESLPFNRIPIGGVPIEKSKKIINIVWKKGIQFYYLSYD